LAKPSPLEIGRYLAREVAYRGFRSGRVAPSWARGSARAYGFRPPSALRANVLGAVFYGIMSVFLGLPVAIGAPYVEPMAAFEVGASLLLGLCVVFTLMQVAPFTATFVSEGVVDLVRILPIDTYVALLSYLSALFLYWGALSILALFVPFLALSFAAAARGSIPVAAALAGVFSSLSTLALSVFLGLALGIASYSARRRVSLRIASTLGWLAAFTAMYAVISFHESIVRHLASYIPRASSWLGYVPFLGPIYAFSSPIPLAASCATTIAVIYGVYRASISRLEALLSGAELAAERPRPAPRRAAEARIRVSHPLAALVRKDLKLLSREPRRLASLLYLVVFPIIFAIAFSWGSASRLSGAILAAPCFIGALSGLGSDNLFFVEGSGAKVLYHLPIDRRTLALSKALATSLVTAPIACAASATLVLLATGSPTLALGSAALAVALNVGTSMLNSAVSTKLLPREPSSWSELSVSTTIGRRFTRSAIKIGVSIASTAVPLAIAIGASSAGLGLWIVATAVSSYAAAILIAGAILVARLRGDLTS